MKKPLRNLALFAFLVGAMPLTSRHAAPVGSMPDPPRSVFTGPRTSCGLLAPLKVDIVALATPVVGAPLTLRVTARNRGLPGPFQCSIRAPDGALEGLEDNLVWTRELPINELVTWTTPVKVLKGGPIPITVKARSLSSGAANTLPAEAYLTLYPFELHDGHMAATWDEQTLRPLDEAPRPIVTLPDGDHAMVFKVGATLRTK